MKRLVIKPELINNSSRAIILVARTVGITTSPLLPLDHEIANRASNELSDSHST